MEEMAGEISALEWIHPIGEMKALPPFYSAMHGKSPVITKFESNRSFKMHMHKVYRVFFNRLSSFSVLKRKTPLANQSVLLAMTSSGSLDIADISHCFHYRRQRTF